MERTSSDDTIVAISTPIGEGGISIVRLSGSQALKIADEIFISRDGRKASTFRTYTTHYGHIGNRDMGYGIRDTLPLTRNPNPEIIDEVILTVMRAPKSYTKEDVVEINCHGGIRAAKKVLDLVLKRGSRMAEPGEFTKRAFLNGRIDLAQAEAVLDVIRAKTDSSLKVAVGQLEGELSNRIERLRSKILDIASQIEAGIDFPDEDIEILKEGDCLTRVGEILSELKEVISTYDEGMVYREGILAIICGKPNVGKSSLMNLLLKRDRVIVSPIPGTTRDAVEEMINLKGAPVRLVDTAGIDETEDLLVKEGVRKSKKYLARSDMVLLVLDASTKIDKKDLALKKLVDGKKKIVIINKCDLARKIEKEKLTSLFRNDEIVEISVKTRRNMDLLEKAILDAIFNGAFEQGESVVVSNARHKELLDKTLVNMLSVDKTLREGASLELAAIDLKEALFNLGLIIGKTVSDDVLDRIFEQFCIGK